MNWIHNPTWAAIQKLPDNQKFYGPELPTHLTLLNTSVAKTLRCLDFGAGIGRNRDYLHGVFQELHEYDIPEFGYKNLIEIANTHYDIINACFTFQFMDHKDIVAAISFLEKVCDTFYLTTRTYCNTGENVLKTFLDAGFRCIAATRNVELFSNQNDEDCGEFLLTKSHFPQKFELCHKTGELIYLSYQDVFSDVRDWCKTLDIAAVSGVPRSGLIIAAMISQIKNIPLIPVECLTGDFDGWRPGSSRKIPQGHGPTLIVDDTSWSGTSMFLLKKKFQRTFGALLDNIQFGALYASPNSTIKHYKKLPHVNHTFDWNFLRDINVGNYCLDFDGVLCEDFAGGDSEGDDYLEHLVNAKPLYLPNYKVKKIVSARIEKYRSQTEEWLHRHGVRYGELCLLNVTSHKHRNPQNAIEHKSRNYDPDALLFVESCPIQAAEIKKLTGRKVFCTDQWRML